MTFADKVPCQQFQTISFIMVVHGETAVWAAGKLLAAILQVTTGNNLSARLSAFITSCFNDTFLKRKLKTIV